MKIKLFMNIVLFLVIVTSASASIWVDDPNNCPTEYQSQNCLGGDKVCGFDSGIVYCYDTSTISPPSTNGTSNTLYNSSFPGGYILDCTAYDGSSPFCDNSGSLWCNRNSTCYSTKNRDTKCLQDVFVQSFCGDCRSGYQNCTGDDACEVLTGVTSCSGGANNNIGANCTCQCDTGYLDCDGSGPDSGDGCEILNGSSCSVGDLDGFYDGCSGGVGNCVVAKSYFETGTETSYLTNLSLLWGNQYGIGWLINFTSKNTNQTFGVDNDACAVFPDNTTQCTAFTGVNAWTNNSEQIYIQDGYPLNLNVSDVLFVNSNGNIFLDGYLSSVGIVRQNIPFRFFDDKPDLDHLVYEEVAPSLIDDKNSLEIVTTSLENGNFVVAFSETGTGYGKFYIFDQDGGNVSGEKTFDSTGVVTQMSITPLEGGNFVIGYGITASNVKAVVYDSSGTLVNGPTEINSSSLATSTCASTLLNGNVVFTFVTSAGAGKPQYTIYDPVNDVVVDTDFIDTLVSGDIGCSVLPDGNFMAIYDKSSNMYYAIHDESGTQLTSPTLLDSGASSGHILTPLRNGNIFLVYENGVAGRFLIIDKEGSILKPETSFIVSDVKDMSSGLLSNGNVFISFIDVDDSDKGKYLVYNQFGELIQSDTFFNDNCEDSSSSPSRSNNVIISYRDDTVSKIKYTIYSANEISTNGLTVDGDLNVTGNGFFYGNVSIGSSDNLAQLGVGQYQGGTVGSAIENYSKQAIISGAYNNVYNSDDAVKLLISDFSNDAGDDIYPIYVEDENNKVNFYLRSLSSAGDSPQMTAFFGGNVQIGTSSDGANKDITITGKADTAIILEADTDNANENHNPYIRFSQDGGLIKAILGIVGNAGNDPQGNSYTGTSSNSLLLGGIDESSLHLGTNTNVRFTINADGDIGIGTTSPNDALDVLGTSNFNGKVIVGSDGGASGIGADSELNVRGNSVNNISATIQNYYYNSASPTAELRFAGYPATIYSNETAAGKIVSVRESTYSESRFSHQSALAFYTAYQGYDFEHMRIDSLGKIGIGTDTPTSLLHVAPSTTSRSSIRIENGTAPSSPNVGDLWAESTDNGKLYYQRNSLENFDLSNQPSKITYVNSIYDLTPLYNPSTGDIELENDTRYIFPGADVEIQVPFPIEFGKDSTIENARITTAQPIKQTSDDGEMQIRSSVIVYAGNDSLIQINDNGVVSRFIEVNFATFNVHGKGTIFNISNDVGEGSIVVMKEMAILRASPLLPGAESLGTIKNTVTSISTCQFEDFQNGLTLNNVTSADIGTVQMQTIYENLTFLNFTGDSIGNLQINGVAAILDSENNCIFNFDQNTEFTSVSVSISAISILGTATKDDIFCENSYNQTEINFKFIGNTNIPDSTANAKIGFEENSIETIIDATETPVKVNATFEIINGEPERFNWTSDGRLTYIGTEDIRVEAKAKIKLEPSLGITIILGGYIAKNGDYLNSSEWEESISAGSPETILPTDHISLSNGDYLEIYVDNHDSTADILVIDANFLVNKI